MSGLIDSSGSIVIDEQEAALDIRNIEEVKNKLTEARRLLDPNKLVDARMLGETRNALDGLLGRICRELRGREARCDDAGNFIKTVVEKYKDIDREFSRQMGGNLS